MKAQPKYMQIINYYTGLIESGELNNGDKMPTENEICDLFTVSRITVRKALDSMLNLELITKVQGKGSYVSCKKADMQLNHLNGFSEEMKNLGLVPSTRVLEQKIISPSKTVAEALDIDLSQKIYLIIRLRLADGTPMAIERLHIPFSRFAGIENEDLSKSLYELLKTKYGLESSEGRETISAGLPSKNDVELLDILHETPILSIKRTTFDMQGVPFEYVDSVYRSDKYQFNVTLKR